jgi:hypothetical protein
MKLILVLICTILSFNSFSQCPPGSVVVGIGVSWECDFHRPKFKCEKGFWFCCTKTRMIIRCSSLPRNNSEIFGELVNNQMVFHFPIEFKKRSKLTEEELKTFNVDEALEFNFNGVKFKLVIGDYSTEENEVEIVAKVNIEMLNK